MIRTGELRKASSQIKQRAKKAKCKQCRQSFDAKGNTLIDRFCNLDCAVAYGLAKKEKVAKRKLVVERAELKARKEKLKTKSYWVREAQAVWNAYVRWRDYGKPCASCGVVMRHIPGGHNIDCSHYRSVGSAPHLRFHLHNAAAACVRCNRDLSGNVVELRKGLIARIGLEKVEAIEANNVVRKFDIEYLVRLKRIFTKKLNRLRKLRSDD